MEHTRSPGPGSGNSGAYSPEEMAESLRFEEEIQSLMLPPPSFDPPPATGGSSFTALLGLPPSQAVELLHDPPHPQPLPGGFSMQEALAALPLGCSPTFPSNAALIDRAARYSVFAAESPEVSNSGGEILPSKLKAEPADSGDRAPASTTTPPQQRAAAGIKRKDAEKSKAKGSSKKSKSAENGGAGDCEKLPYVHVRARRGQATDSHSLAERARREKINARMKLLQELVPGCSKISGTALVLDEIINHVQLLQRQVEFLSMRLAAVNPRIDFGGLDHILSAECGRFALGNGRSAVGGIEQSMVWMDAMINKQQQLWFVDPQQQQQPQEQQMWERDDSSQQGHIFVSNQSTASVFAYDESADPNSGSIHDNQLKTELISSIPNHQLKTEL